ncbi:MAG: hypothetical protein HYS18_12310 [Burkholderiales bacterium]|nr:hypothetical protein [Burkholderiales bacterium]
MSNGKRVLLARPHPFIVADMKPLLLRAGFVPSPLSALAEIAAGAATGAKGAVISIALSSPIPESAETVFAALRQHVPRLPILFAGLVDFETARRTIDRILHDHAAQATVTPVEAIMDARTVLGKPHTYLYLGKETLKTDAGAALAERALARHFV